MIDALDCDRERSLLRQNDEAFLFQIPLMEVEMLIRALQHILQIKTHYAGVLSILPSFPIQELEDSGVRIGIVKRRPCLETRLTFGRGF